MDITRALSLEERQAFELISTQGGLLQSQLWKQLETDSRTGSRIATSLEEKGMIEREPTTNNGQRTYLLKPTVNKTELNRSDSAGSEAARTDNERTEWEAQALYLIHDQGGIDQSDFWKALEVSSRAGSRIATSLEANGVIRRTETVHNGQRTYFLDPTQRHLDFSLLMAGDMITPTIAADGELDPIHSDEFSQFVRQLAKNHD